MPKDKHITEAKRIISEARSLNETDESGHRKVSHPSKLGNGSDDITSAEYAHMANHDPDHVIKIHREPGDPDPTHLRVHYTKKHTLVSSRGGYPGGHSEWKFKGKVHPRDVAANHKWAAKKYGGEDIKTDHD